MNRRQVLNKILHDHIDVNPHEDYTNYKELITAIEEWHEKELSDKAKQLNKFPDMDIDCDATECDIY